MLVSKIIFLHRVAIPGLFFCRLSQNKLSGKNIQKSFFERVKMNFFVFGSRQQVSTIDIISIL